MIRRYRKRCSEPIGLEIGVSGLLTGFLIIFFSKPMALKTAAIVGGLITFGFLEMVSPFFQKSPALWRSMAVNVGLALCNTLLVSCTTALLLLGVFQQARVPVIPPLLGILAIDAYLYFWHRLMHSTYWGWRLHAVHHSDRHLTTLSAYRFHGLEVLLSNLPKIGIVWLLGIPSEWVIIYESVYAIELLFHHSNWSLSQEVDRWLSWLIVTPNYHRLHHSCLPINQRSNYASLLTIWDWLFRSRRYPEEPRSLQIGLISEAQTLGVMQLLFLPFK